MDQLEHLVMFEAGHDCITFECKFNSKECKPGEGGSHGKHGLTIRFLVKGKEGVVQFVLYTGWLPRDKKGIGWTSPGMANRYPMPADLGYHSRVPMFEGQGVASESCEYLDGAPCFYDGSTLSAIDAMYCLVNGGHEALWKFLDDYYAHVFFKQRWPDVISYPKPRRKEEV